MEKTIEEKLKILKRIKRKLKKSGAPYKSIKKIRMAIGKIKEILE